MKIFCAILALIALAFPASALMANSGDRVGNGGDIVLCEKPGPNENRPPQLLDFYEGLEDGHTVSIGAAHWTFQQKLELLLSRLRRVDAARAERYQQLLPALLAPTNFLPGIELVDVPDSGHLYFPKGCKVVQIAIQEEPSLLARSPFVFSRDLWELLDNDNKAGLLLHELIYHEAIRFGHTDSRMVRRFVSLLADPSFEGMTQSEYRDFVEGKLSGAPFRYPHIHILFSSAEDPPHYYDNGQIKWAYLRSDKESFFLDPSGNKIHLVPGSSIGFWPSGEVESFESKTNLKFFVDGEWTEIQSHYNNVREDFSLTVGVPVYRRNFNIQGKIRLTKPDRAVEFNKKGEVIQAALSHNETFELNGKPLYVRGSENPSEDFKIEFYPNLSFKAAFLAQPFTVRMRGVDLVIQDYISFHQNGALERGNFEGSILFPVMNQILPISKQVAFYENGDIRSCLFSRDVTVTYLGMEIPIAGRKESGYDEGVTFFSGERLSEFKLSKQTNFRANDGASYELMAGGQVKLFEDGSLRSGRTKLPYEKVVQGQNLSFINVIEFFPTGEFHHGTLNSAEATLKTTRGYFYTFKKGEDIFLREDGLAFSQ